MGADGISIMGECDSIHRFRRETQIESYAAKKNNIFNAINTIYMIEIHYINRQ
jgi:hypothetical protein